MAECVDGPQHFAAMQSCLTRPDLLQQLTTTLDGIDARTPLLQLQRLTSLFVKFFHVVTYVCERGQCDAGRFWQTLVVATDRAVPRETDRDSPAFDSLLGVLARAPTLPPGLVAEYVTLIDTLLNAFSQERRSDLIAQLHQYACLGDMRNVGLFDELEAVHPAFMTSETANEFREGFRFWNLTRDAYGSAKRLATARDVHIAPSPSNTLPHEGANARQASSYVRTPAAQAPHENNPSKASRAHQYPDTDASPARTVGQRIKAAFASVLHFFKRIFRAA